MIESSSPRTASRAFAWAARFLARVESRLILSAAIIVSLLPFDWVSSFDAPFLILFGVEFLLRAMLIFRGEGQHAQRRASSVTGTEAEAEEAREWQRPSTGTLILLVFDLLALLSFIPSLLGVDVAETRWLRLFRLSRMMLLLSYWGPLVRDVWSVLLERERAKQIALMGCIVLALSFAGAVVIEQMRVGSDEVIDFDGDGRAGESESGEVLDPDDQRFYAHLWWAFRQIQDPGNMMSSPEQAAALVVSVALTIVGLFMVSFLIGLGTDVVRELMELSQIRPPGLRGHTIVVNINPSTQQLIHELIGYSRKLLPIGALSLRWLAELVRNTQRGLRGGRYLVVGRSHDPPDFLRQRELARCIYRQVQVDEQSFLHRTDVADAQRVVLLADLDAKDPDAATIQSLLTITDSLREADERASRRATLFGFGGVPKRARLLIAEVLDESNVAAARAAIAGDGTGRDSARTRAFVVPSERLIALFIACKTLRPGVGRLLEELLTSHGHELYTMFFNLPGLGYQRDSSPALANDPSQIMGELIERARSLPSRGRVVPVGVLMAGDGVDDIRVYINPEPEFAEPGGERLEYDLEVPLESGGNPRGEQGSAEDFRIAEPPVNIRPGLLAAGESRCLGFIAIADNFGRVRELADDLYDRPREQVGPRPRSVQPIPALVPAETSTLGKVLVCGFRSGTVSMVEALIHADRRTQILIIVANEDARAAAWDAFDAHTKLVRRGLLTGHHGQFHANPKVWALTWARIKNGRSDELAQRPHIHIVVGDWSSSRQLSSLPLGFGHVETVDAVVLISNEQYGSDARTAKALMKLETLTAAPRIIAEVLDVELARRLRRRSANQNSTRVSVYSIQALRAFFMFQSIVVPAFDPVYAELMGPWGESFVQLKPEPAEQPQAGECSFESLADTLSRSGRVLVAVELCLDHQPHTHDENCRTTLDIAAASQAEGLIDLGRLLSVWVISRDDSIPTADRSTRGSQSRV